MKQNHRLLCPPLDALQQPQHRDHLAACLYCQTDLKMLLDFEHATPERHEKAPMAAIVDQLRATYAPAPQSNPTPWFGWFSLPRLVGGFAALLILAAMGLQWQAGRGGSQQELLEAGVTRAAAEIRLEPQGDLPEVPARLRWNAIPGAARYELSFTEVDGTPLTQATVNVTEYALPPAMASAMLPGKTVLLGVRGLDTNGKVLAEVTGVPLRLVAKTGMRVQ